MKSLYCNQGTLSCNCVISMDWKEADIGVWYLDSCTTPVDIARLFERALTNPNNTYAVVLDRSLSEVADLLEWQLGNVYRDITEFMCKMEEVLHVSIV